jgi:hypothetical protein
VVFGAFGVAAAVAASVFRTHAVLIIGVVALVFVIGAAAWLLKRTWRAALDTIFGPLTLPLTLSA